MKLKWLFFDLGGTIYDETYSDKERIEKLLVKTNSNISFVEFYSEMVNASERFESSAFTAARRCFGIEENEQYSNEKEILYPYAIDIVSKLSNSYHLAILANQPANTLERLKTDGIFPYFELCFLSECENLFKPDIRFFEYALEKAGCIPEEAAMIGDRLDNDILPAKKIGMKTIRIAQGLHSSQQPISYEYTPDFQLQTLSDLLRIL